MGGLDDAARPIWILDAYAQERAASFIYEFLTEDKLLALRLRQRE